MQKLNAQIFLPVQLTALLGLHTALGRFKEINSIYYIKGIIVVELKHIRMGLYTRMYIIGLENYDSRQDLCSVKSH